MKSQLNTFVSTQLHPVLNSPELPGTCHADVTATLQLPVLHPKTAFTVHFLK
jgi:hypothetical protein